MTGCHMVRPGMLRGSQSRDSTGDAELTHQGTSPTGLGTSPTRLGTSPTRLGTKPTLSGRRTCSGQITVGRMIKRTINKLIWL